MIWANSSFKINKSERWIEDMNGFTWMLTISRGTQLHLLFPSCRHLTRWWSTTRDLDCYNYDCFACSLEINISNTFYIFQLTLTVIFYWPIQGKKAKLWYKSLLLLRWTETESDYCPCKPWTSLLTLRCRHWTVIASHSLLFFLLLFFPAPLFYSTERNRREWFCNRLINVNLVSLAVITLKL